MPPATSESQMLLSWLLTEQSLVIEIRKRGADGISEADALLKIHEVHRFAWGCGTDGHDQYGTRLRMHIGLLSVAAVCLPVPPGR